jgi:hypothetical protein
MVGGTWTEGEKKVRAGFFMRFISKAQSAISAGVRGVVAIPVKSNWGPVKTVIEINSEKSLSDTFGTDTTNGFTAYESIWLTLLGGPSKILAYRLVDGNEKASTITLKDAEATPADVLKLDSLYPTTRAFNVTVRDNLADPTNKTDLILYENTTQLKVFTFDKGSIDGAVTAINGDQDNVWLTASKVADGNGQFAAITNQNLTGGNAGISNVTNQNYVDAMSAFEAQEFNGFVLDGVSDSALQLSVKSWTDRLRSEGKKIISFYGGSLTDDDTYTNGNNRSISFNSEAAVNVHVSGQLADKWYSSAQVACFVAGFITGQPLRDSATYKSVPFTDIKPRLTNSQIIDSIKAGTLVLFHDGEKVLFDKAVNTLTTLSSEQGPAWKKIKAVRIMDAIDIDTTTTARDEYIGRIVNNEDGQKAFLSAIKNYFETLAPDLISEDFTVETDAERMATANSDEFYWMWNAKLIDSMEVIYGTGYVG